MRYGQMRGGRQAGANPVVFPAVETTGVLYEGVLQGPDVHRFELKPMSDKNLRALHLDLERTLARIEKQHARRMARNKRRKARK